MSEESYIVEAKFVISGNVDAEMRRQAATARQVTQANAKLERDALGARRAQERAAATEMGYTQREAYRMNAQFDRDRGSAAAAAHRKASELEGQKQAAGAQYARAQSQMFSALGSGASRIGDALNSAVDRAAQIGVALAAGAAFGGAALVKKGLEVNAQYEDVRMSIAAINSASTGKSFWDSFRESAPLIEKMRADAAALPGTSLDLANIYRTIAAPSQRAGKDSQQIEALSAQLMAAGKAAGLDSATIARESAGLIAGNAGGHNLLGARLGGLTGDRAKEWNQHSDLRRFNDLQTMMGKYSGAIDGYQHSWSGLSSTLVENAQHFLQLSTSGLFERVKDALEKGNDWYATHQKQVEAWADTIGRGLVAGFDRAVTLAEKLVALAEKYGKNISGADVATGLKHATEAYAAFKVARTAASFMPSMATLSAGATLLGGGEAAGGAAALANPIGLAVGAAVVTGLVAAGIGTAGAASVLSDPTSKFHKASVMMAENTATEMSKAAANFAAGVAVLQPAIDATANLIGSVWLSTVDLAAESLNGLAIAFRSTASFFANPASYVGAMFGNGPKLSENDDEREQRDPMSDWYKQGPMVDLGKKLTAFADGKAPKVSGHSTTNNFHSGAISISLATNQDPSKIARLTKATLLQLAQSPGHSRSPQSGGYTTRQTG
jgi:hypothetical protein